MKLKTSFFNPTAFRKNLTRFAPVWGLYTIALFLGLFLMMDSGVDYWLFSNIADCIEFMSVVNCGYALLCTQLLFGDLYNARMCNMLHALPIRREGWFVTHVASGLAFSFGPNLAMALAAMALTPFSNMVNAWQIPLYWWLGSGLQFLFFFALAVFAALCVGSRFAQAVVYGILNFASPLAFFLVDTLYTPMLYGVYTNEAPFLWFCPAVKMLDTRYIDCDQIETFLGYTREGYEHYAYHGEFTVTGEWWYLLLCAAVGIGLLAAALLLYRKRQLEVAGDFIAIRGLEPVFLVIYTLVVGTCFHFVFQEMMGYYNGIIFNFVGLTIGWFTGRMLLERRVNVFHKRSFLGLGALMAAFLLSLGIVYADPMGIEDWVPDAEEVAAVHVGTGHGTYHQSEVTLHGQADIEKIIAIHESALEKRIDEHSREIVEVITNPQPIDGMEVTTEEVIYKEQADIKLTYTLKNGTTKTRYYCVYVEDPEGQVLRKYFSSTDAVLGIPRESITPAFLDQMAENLFTSGYAIEAARNLVENLTHEQKVDLLKAIVADCDAGNMVQYYAFQRYRYTIYWLGWQDNGHREIDLTTANTHVVQWFIDNGVDIEAALIDEYGEEYYKYG